MQKQYVQSLFDSIASRYDLLNHLLSGGTDVYWRKRAIEHLRAAGARRILDVATGTADFALAALRLSPERIIGVDIAEEMLAIGRRKVSSRAAGDVISLETGEAEHLQFADGSFDAAIVAFGARNFEDLPKGLAEMRRVVRQGGTIVVLEFSRPRHFPFRQCYLAYFRWVLPVIGRVISRSPHAYRYLPETVMRFPEGEDFLRILTQAGFRSVDEERLTFGIASVYTAQK